MNLTCSRPVVCAFLPDIRPYFISPLTNITSFFFQCLGVEDLLNWHNYSSSQAFNRSQFQSFLPSILFFLTPLEPGSVGAVCNKSTSRSKNLTQNAYNSFLHQYGKGRTLPENQIDKILDHINGTLKARLTKKPVSLFKFFD